MCTLYRTDGTTIELPAAVSIDNCRRAIAADTLDTVCLRHMGHPLHVMLLDDNGHGKSLPINAEATKLYLANCRPGTTNTIRGDVIVVPDSDFGE